jgi:hypothetical protein
VVQLSLLASLLGMECGVRIRAIPPKHLSPPQPLHLWRSQQCKSWNKGLKSRDCLMFRPRQRSPPSSNRGPARNPRYHRSFIRCRKKSSCISHTSLYSGVQAPAFFRFRSSESKHASSRARMTAPRPLLYHHVNLSFRHLQTIATSALLNLERSAARGRRGTRLSAGNSD